MQWIKKKIGKEKKRKKKNEGKEKEVLELFVLNSNTWNSLTVCFIWIIGLT